MQDTRVEADAERPAASDDSDAGEPVSDTLRRLQTVMAAVDASPIVIFLWRVVDGQEWPVDYVSAGVRQFGYAPEDFLSGRVSWVGVTHPEDVPRLQAEVAEYHAQGVTTFFQEYRLITRSGEVRWVDDRTFAVPDAAGVITHYAGAIRDITPRKTAQSRLAVQDATLRAVMDSVNNSIYAVDRSYCYTDFNATHEGTMRYLYGVQIRRGGCLLDYLPVEVDRVNARRHFDRALQGERFSVEMQDDRPAVTRETSILYFNPVRSEDGAIIGVSVWVRDATRERQAAEHLRASEEWFRALIENAFGLIVVADREGVIRFASANTLRIMGYGQAQLVGQSAFDFLHPEDLPTARDVFARVLAEPESAILSEYRVRHRDGRWRWAEVTAQNLLHMPTVAAIVFNLRDVTERVDLAQALRESEARLRLTLQNSPIVVYHTDRELRYTWIHNPRHGYEAQALLGKRDDELLPAEDAALLMALKQRVLERGIAERQQICVRPRGGSAAYDVYAEPLRDAAGAITGVTVVAVDITERVTMEQALRESEDRFRVALGTVPIVASHVDRDLRYTWIHNARHGFRAEDIIGRRDDEFLPPELAATWMELKRRVLATGVGEHVLHELNLGEGVTIYDTVIEPVRSPAGAITGLTVVSYDVTALKRAEAEVRRLNAALEQRVAERTAELQESEERYRLFFNAQTHGAMVFGIAPSRVLDANEAAVALYGYSREELLALDDPAVLTAEPEKTRSAFMAQMDGDLRPIPLRYHRRKDGTRVPVEIWPSVFRLKGQRVLGVIIVDISRLEAAERQLRESESKFRVLAEELPNMVFIRQDGRLVYVNQRCVDVMGYERDEFYAPAFDFFALVETESDAVMRSRFAAHLQGREPESGEYTLRTRSGHRIDVILETRAVDFENGKAVLGLVTDITSRREAERYRLRQQERLKRLAAKLAVAQDDEQRRIADGLHDDVAQVLTACRYRLAGLHGGMADDAVREIRADLDALLGQAQQTIRSLSFELASSTLHQRELAPAVEALCQEMTKRYAVHFAFRQSGPPVSLNAEATVVVFKATRELLFNVVKHAGVDRAAVRMDSDVLGLRIVVEDHGRGFPPATGAKGAELGRGLGVYKIRERLRDVGGRMRIESRSGVRTRITLTVPYAEE